MNDGLETLTYPTTNGLKNLNLYDLTANVFTSNSLNSENIVSTEIIEANNIRVGNELDLSLTGINTNRINPLFLFIILIFFTIFLIQFFNLFLIIFMTWRIKSQSMRVAYFLSMKQVARISRIF